MLLLKNIQMTKSKELFKLIPVVVDIRLVTEGLDMMVDNSPTEDVVILGVDVIIVDVIILDDANVWIIEELSRKVD